MGENKSQFNALTPEILDKNKSIYTEALDYAFSNNDIKNIAITGIYGAGKSSVWKTYANNKNLNNCITVSLGKYDDSTIKEEDKIGLENRLERQLINQMLSQINASDIPLSKYKFKVNIADKKLIQKVFWTIPFILSILLWFIRDQMIMILNDFFAQISSRIIVNVMVGILFIIPVTRFLFYFYKENKVI